MLEVTAAGTRALRDWIGPPVEAWKASVTLDPIRTRVLFSGVLTSSRRRALFAEAERALEEVVTMLTARRRRERASGPTEEWMATTGALAAARARLRWLRWVQRTSVSGQWPVASSQ